MLQMWQTHVILLPINFANHLRISGKGSIFAVEIWEILPIAVQTFLCTLYWHLPASERRYVGEVEKLEPHGRGKITAINPE